MVERSWWCGDPTEKNVLIDAGRHPLPPPKQTVTVCTYLDGSVHIFWGKEELAWTMITKKTRARNPTQLRAIRIRGDTLARSEKPNDILSLNFVENPEGWYVELPIP